MYAPLPEPVSRPLVIRLIGVLDADLIAAFALLILIVAACRFLSSSSSTPSTAVFIVPSQSVRW